MGKDARNPSPLVLGPGSSPVFPGPFRKNLMSLFRIHGEKVTFTQMKHAWVHMVQVKYTGTDGSCTNLKLHFYTELLSHEYNNLVCDECRIMGWQHHAVGVKRVHVILPSEKTLANPRTLMSLMEMRHRGWMHRARLDASKIAREKEDDTGDGTAEFVAAENMFHSKSHLLHGVLHMNGFGHLCRVNGREGGSSLYTGSQLMNVWDELCTVLRARVVSVEDVSNKLTMELRILLPLAYGKTWYGRWAYEFGRAPFNIQAARWREAVQAAADVRLSDLIAFCSTSSATGQLKPKRGWKSVLAVLQRYNMARLIPSKPTAHNDGMQPNQDSHTGGDSQPVQTIGDLLKVMMDAMRHPSADLCSLISARGGGGQNPHEQKLADVHGLKNGEAALIEAYHAQEQPVLQDDALLQSAQLGQEQKQASAKRNRKNGVVEEAAYSPKTKRVKKAESGAVLAAPKLQSTSLKTSKSNVQRGEKTANKVSDPDFEDPAVQRKAPARRARRGKAGDSQRHSPTGCAVLAYEGLAEPSSIEGKSGFDGVRGSHAGSPAQHTSPASNACPGMSDRLPRASRNRQPSSRLVDYDMPRSRTPSRRCSRSPSPAEKIGAQMVLPHSDVNGEAEVVHHSFAAMPQTTKSGRKRVMSLRAERAAEALTSEVDAELAERQPQSCKRAAAPRSSSNTVLPSTAAPSSRKSLVIRTNGSGKGVVPSKTNKGESQARSNAAPPVHHPAAVPHPAAVQAPSAAVKLWCENINNLSPGGCINHKHASMSSIKNQIMSDLLCLYFALFRTDVSENLVLHLSMLQNIANSSGATLTKPPPKCGNAAVSALRDALSILRYTKHFVKDYHGELAEKTRPVKNVQPKSVKKKPNSQATEMRFLVTVLMDFSCQHFGSVPTVTEQPSSNLEALCEQDDKESSPDDDRNDKPPAKKPRSIRIVRRLLDQGVTDTTKSGGHVEGQSARIMKEDPSSAACVSENVASQHEVTAQQLASIENRSCSVEPCAVQAVKHKVDSSPMKPSALQLSHEEVPKSNSIDSCGRAEVPENLGNKQALQFGAESMLDGIAEPAGVDEQGDGKGDDTKGNDTQGDDIVGDAVKGDDTKGDHTKGDDTKADDPDHIRVQNVHATPSESNIPVDIHADHLPSKPPYQPELDTVLGDQSTLAFHQRPPPAELVIVQASTTVAEFKRSISVALKETYHLFSKFQVSWVHCPMFAETRSAGKEESSEDEQFFQFGHMPPEKDRIERHFPLTDAPVHLVVAGPGLEMNSQLRHAGGEADWVVSCCCGVKDDDGERMLCCDVCGNWVHGLCEGIADSEPDPSSFTCSQCRSGTVACRNDVYNPMC